MSKMPAKCLEIESDDQRGVCVLLYMLIKMTCTYISTVCVCVFVCGCVFVCVSLSLFVCLSAVCLSCVCALCCLHYIIIITHTPCWRAFDFPAVLHLENTMVTLKKMYVY